MSNHRLINRRTGFFLGLVLVAIGVFGIVYNAARPRFRQKQIPAVIDQVYLVPPQPRANPVSTPQPLPKTGTPRSDPHKTSRGTNRKITKHHASRVQTGNEAELWTRQTASTSVLDQSTSDQVSYNTDSQKEILSRHQGALHQPSPVPGSRCTRLIRGEGKKVGIFRGVLNLIKRMLGLKPAPVIFPNQPPTVSLAASAETITMPCPPGLRSSSGACPSAASTTVGLTTTASDPDGDTLLYTYTVTGGRITGEGANVSWDLGGVGPGTYTALVEVDDGCGCITTSSTTVTIANCPDCVPDLVCPSVEIECPPSLVCPLDVREGTPVTFSAKVSAKVSPTYNWKLTPGTITVIEGNRGTSQITVSTINLGGQSINATVELGVDPSCNRTASRSIAVVGLPPPTPTPTPTSSPQPLPAPTSEMFSKTSSTPTPTPGAQGTPCASPTPVPKDFVEITYPEYMLANDGESEVHFTLSSADGRSERQPDQPGAIRRFFRWLGALFGKTPSPPTEPQAREKIRPNVEDWCKYDGFARAKLEPPANLDVRSGEGNDGDGYQSLDSSETLTWVWYVKGNKTVSTPLKIRLYFWWKSKVSGIPDKRPIEVWPNDGRVFQVSVQEPTIWNLVMSITSWLIAGLGTTLMSIFIGPWIKRRLKRWIKRYT